MDSSTDSLRLESCHAPAALMRAASPTSIPGMKAWADARGLHGVVWTALPSVFGGVERVPGEDEVVGYLRGLRGAVRDEAERYIRRAPRQTDTAWRRRIEAEFGWTPIDD